MTLGLAAIIIFVLYLIDKHHLWKIAVKIAGGLVALAAIAFGLFYAYASYSDYRTKKEHEAYVTKMQPVWDCEYRNTPDITALVGTPSEPLPGSVYSGVITQCEKDSSVVITLAPPPGYTEADPLTSLGTPAARVAPRPKTILELNHVRWINPDVVNGVSISDDAEQLKCGNGNGAVLGEVMFISGAWVVSYGPDKWDMTVKHGTKGKAEQDVEAHADFTICNQ